MFPHIIIKCLGRGYFHLPTRYPALHAPALVYYVYCQYITIFEEITCFNMLKHVFSDLVQISLKSCDYMRLQICRQKFASILCEGKNSREIISWIEQYLDWLHQLKPILKDFNTSRIRQKTVRDYFEVRQKGIW